MTDDQINEYIELHYMHLSDSEIAAELGISPKAVKNRRHRRNLYKSVIRSDQSQQMAEGLDQIITNAEEVGKVKRIAVSKRITSKPEGDTSYTTSSVVIDPNFGLKWDLVNQAKPTTIKPIKVNQVKRNLKVAIVYPDQQIHYRYYPDTQEYDPFHDTAAMDVALQIAQDVQPDLQINLGDTLDLPTFGRYAQEPYFALTTQESLNYTHEHLAMQRANAPKSEIVYIPGNHEERLAKYIMANAAAAYGLRRAGDPSEWPVLSVPFLLRLDELNVQYAHPYPAGDYYINEKTKCMHGRRTGKGRALKQTLLDERVNTIIGHNHHIEYIEQTIDTRHGPVYRWCATLGTLARIDGAVPATNSAIDLTGRPVKKYMDWQQSIGLVYYDDEEYSELQIIPIRDGKAVFSGKIYQAGS